jgi:hypothetical protein
VTDCEAATAERAVVQVIGGLQNCAGDSECPAESGHRGRTARNESRQDADLTVHKSAPPLTHQVGAGGGFGLGFNCGSAAPAAPIAPRVNNTTQAAADLFKGAS